MDKDLTASADTSVESDAQAEQATDVIEEQLIEEISIDGMCGVY